MYVQDTTPVAELTTAAALRAALAGGADAHAVAERALALLAEAERQRSRIVWGHRWSYETEDLRAQGYRPGAPAAEAAEIDGGVCRAGTCRDCGHAGLEYHPYWRPGSYRAYARCPRCGRYDEF